MTISIDTNVIVALWWHADALNQDALRVLDNARRAGPLAVSAPVYAELMGDPDRTAAELDLFLRETAIAVDWEFEEEIWREAGGAYQGYIRRRKQSGGSLSRRILTDFLIGAHASVRGYALLTLDRRLSAAAFPRLKIVTD